jgi:predicted ATP-binding protein involved in virulence
MNSSKSVPATTPTNNGGPIEKDQPNREPAYFLSLSLENVRCFGPKQTLDLSDGNGKPAQWTIILGVNGTGKTTLLQSLVGFEWLSESDLDWRRTAPRFLNTRLFDDEAITRNDSQEDSQLIAEIGVGASFLAKPSRVVNCYFKIDNFLAKVVPSPGSVIEGPWCCAYGAGRRVGTASFSKSKSNDPTASLFSDRAELRNPEEWLLRLDYAAAKPSDIQKQQKRRLEQVKELLLSILPEVDDIRLTNPGGTNPTPRAEFKTPYGWVPLRQLGYGYQTLITWVADLANRMVERYPDSPDPLAEPAVVLVDEIDLHLHPKWQRKLMGFLTERFPNTQFIATAHSPLVAQAAADANLAVLRRDGDHVVIENDVDNIRGWRIDQILTSDLFGLETARPPQIENLLLERKAILTKPKLTKPDEKRLKELEAEIGELPTGETAQDVKEREEIRKTLELLRKGQRTPR